MKHVLIRVGIFFLICISLSLAIIVTCPAMPLKTSYYPEIEPELCVNTVNINVNKSREVWVKNIDANQISSLTVQSDDPMIASVKKESETTLSIRGCTAYEQTTVNVSLILKKAIKGNSQYFFPIKVNVRPDRNLATDDQNGRAPNYSDPHDWLALPTVVDKPVDVFYIYSTQYKSEAEDATSLAPMDKRRCRRNARLVLKSHRPLFRDVANIYAPFYRQTNMKEFLQGEGNTDPMAYQRHEQKLDICDALDYYFEHYNKGRPFILFGHSQGAMMTLIAVEDYMKRHPEYYRRMIAAYAIGFSVTQDDLINYPHLKFAEGADDTGVIVSWNTEGEKNRNKANFVVAPEGSIAINPINWKRDDTYAPAFKNHGSRIYNPDTGRFYIVKDWGDARVDTERGVVITHTNFDPSDRTELYGPESYHTRDISLYYVNLLENIRDRIESYEISHGLRKKSPSEKRKKRRRRRAGNKIRR